MMPRPTGMTQDAMDKTPALSPAHARNDPQLVSICELGRLFSLSPKELIPRISLETATTHPGEPLAQSGAVSDPRRGVPTRDPLASLVSLVSTLQRDPLPALKPVHVTFPLARQAPTESEETESDLDDEPMFVPSTWLQPAPSDENRSVLHQMRPVVLGLIAALALVVPTLLWLEGWLGAPRKPDGGEPAPVAAASKPAPISAVKIPEPPTGKPELPKQHDTSSGHRPAANAADTPAINLTGPEATSQKVVQEATRRIESGDVTGARDLLAAVGNDQQGLVPFALAETYDPNMLAAWGIRGVAPDVPKAKALYGEALDLGNARARQRLDALQ